MSGDLKSLVELCQTVGGKVPAWIQGAGGNLSVKSGNDLLIKASGFRLSDVTENAGIAKLSHSAFKEALAACDKSKNPESAYEDLLARSATSKAVRPSMETGMHSLLGGKWVLHLHSLAGMWMAHCTKSEPSLLAQCKSDFGINIGLVPFHSPGWKLCAAVGKRSQYPILLLENHGVILQGDEFPNGPGGILQEWKKIEAWFCTRKRAKLLMSLLNEERSAAQLSLPVTPWKVYFPDITVFEKELKALSEQKSPQSTSAANAALREMWQATQILHLECPDLAELPESARTAIQNLPSEKHRRKVA